MVTPKNVSRRASCKALRRDKVNTIRRRSASSNIVLYSRFIWVNGSITLIRAETERDDIAYIVRFSKVTSKSLASGTGFYEHNGLGRGKISGELWPGPRLFFSGVKIGSITGLPNVRKLE